MLIATSISTCLSGLVGTLCIARFFTALGAILSLTYLYRFANFIWIYCLKPSSVHKYIYGPAPYAIVTGASDGIGKALSFELYNKGFNLVLHGRNEEKIKKVVGEIRAKCGGSRDVRYFVADASDPNHDFEKIAESLKGLDVTLVVHNAVTLDQWTEKEVMNVVNLNAIFPLRLTRVLLPQLRAMKGPTHVIFVGSLSADIAIQRFGIYASSKSFVQSLSRCLGVDERWPFGSSSNVSFMYAAVGEVVSNSMRAEPGLFFPTSERFAKAFVARIGCGKRRITPWMPHAVQQWSMTPLGENVIEMFSGGRVLEIIKQEIKDI